MLSDKATRLKRDVVLEWFGDRAAFIEFHEDLAGLIGEDDYVRDLPGFGNLAGLFRSARK